MNTMISDRAADVLNNDRKVYTNRSQVTAYREGYLQALGDIYRRANAAGEQLPASVIDWLENNS